MKKFSVLFLLSLFMNQASAVDDCASGKRSLATLFLNITPATIYSIPKLCKPLVVNDFSVDKGLNTQVYTLNWSKQEHDLWYVNSYEIRVDGVDVTSYDYTIGLPLTHTLAPGNVSVASFEIRACSEVDGVKECGQWQSTSTQCDGGCVEQPDAMLVSNISIYKDPYRNKFKFNWIDNQAVVTDYQIQSLDASGNEIGEIKQFGQATLLPLTVNYASDGIEPDKFKLRACTISTSESIFECSSWTSNITPNLAPARVLFLESLWANYHINTEDADNNNSHHIHFKYLSEHMDANLNANGYFKLDIDGTVIDTITFNSGNITDGWDSREFSRHEYEFTIIRVKACVNDSLSNVEICGSAFSVPVSDAPMRISTPNQDDHEFLPAPHPLVGCSSSTNTITLSITADDNDGLDPTLVDYFRISEGQPVAQAIDFDTPGRTSISYVTEVDRSIDGQVSSTLRLKRMVNGQYTFLTRACHKNEGAPDSCGEAIYPHNFGCNIGKTLSITPVASNNIKWYPMPGNPTKKVIKWTYPGTVKPDYFYIRKTEYRDLQIRENVSGAATNACVTKRDVGTGDTSNIRTYSKYEFSQLKANEAHNHPLAGLVYSDPEYWSTRMTCSEGIQVASTSGTNNWDVYACQNGIGCTEPTVININATNGQIPGPSNPISQLNTVGGPGAVNPGMWWNQYQAGTGWHFYWVNKISGLSDTDTLSNPYDLRAYWLTYKEIEGIWSPVWLSANMIHVPNSTDGIEKYIGSLDYSYMNNGDVVKISSGSIELIVNTSAGNRKATILLDLDANGGVFTQEQINYEDVGANVPDDYKIINNGKIKIPLVDFGNLVTDNPVYGDPNDLDHYTGAWSNADNNVTVITWIENNFELMDVLVFDDDLGSDDVGEPIWFQSQSCGTNCPVTANWFPDNYNSVKHFYSVTRGFNPLSYAEVDYNLSSYIEYLASAERKLDYDSGEKGSLFNQLQLNFNTNLPGLSNDGDVINRITNYSVSSMTLDKIANVHSIEYFLTNSDGTQVIQGDTCNPNDPDTDGECIIHFNWFTTDDFPEVKAYFTMYDNGVAITEPAPLSELCGDTYNDADPYLEYNYQCLILDGGDYQFELRKPSYSNSALSVQIAESEHLTIIECNTSVCDSQPVEPPATAPNPENYTNSIPPQNLNSSKIGTTSGMFDIDESGAANYSIPIFAPSASGGLAPQLALSYNSNSGNGIAGVGWNIAGTSSITRCLKSPEHDPDLNFYPTIQLDESDALCLDGQRLFKLADGTYRTEMDNFSKITAIGSTGNGPKKFKVKTKSGEIRTYGAPHASYKGDMFTNGTGAQIISNDGVTVHTWLLNKIQDRSEHGNNIHFVWDTFAGENYLSSVRWNNASGYNNHYQVDFEYSASRPDATHHYGIGTQYKAYRHLEHISTFIRPVKGQAALNEVRRLKLTYENLQGSAPSGMLRLESVQQCLDAATTKCLQPVEFEWDAGAANIGFDISAINSTNIGDLEKMGYGSFKPIDVNGDGQMELIFVMGYDDGFLFFEDLEARYSIAYHTDDGNPPYNVAPSHPLIDIISQCKPIEGYYNYICNTGIEPFDAEDDHTGGQADRFNSEKWFTLDYNGDGYQDILSPVHAIPGPQNNDKWVVFLSNGDKLCDFNSANGNESECNGYQPIETGISFYNVDAGSALLDYTADGLPDLLTFDKKTISKDVVLYQYKMYPMVKSNGTYKFSTSLAKFVDIDTTKLVPLDMICQIGEVADGVTRPCVIGTEDDGNGGTNFTQIGSLIVSRVSPVSSDFNGDGYNDAILRYTYMYSDDDSCYDLYTNIGKDGVTAEVNPNNIPKGEYSVSTNLDDAALLGGFINFPCLQSFQAKMLTKINTDGSVSFEYAGRLAIIGNPLYSGALVPPVVECDLGVNATLCRGTANLRYKSSNILDINGDGLADHLYLTNEYTYEYRLNTGKISNITIPDQNFNGFILEGFSYNNLEFGDVQVVSMPPIQGTCPTNLLDPDDYIISEYNQACARTQMVQFLDYDLDGDIDILYPEAEGGSNTVNYALKTFEFFANGTTEYIDGTTLNLKSYDKRGKVNRYINTIMDVNGDGHSDYLNIFRDADSTVPPPFTLAFKYGKGKDKARNKITKITNKLYSKTIETEIEYTVATDASVYEKSTGSFAIDAGNGSPIFDLLTPSYLVSLVEKSSPTASNAIDTTLMTYNYKGLKVQGGGRGSLGFASITSYDPHHNIETTTEYYQSFPLIGMPKNTISRYGTNGYKLSESTSTYLYHETNLGSGHSSYFPYLKHSLEKEYSANTTTNGISVSSAVQKTIVNDFTYDLSKAYPFYGNLLSSDSRTYSGSASSGTTNLVVQKETTNMYEDDVGKWLLGRLSHTMATSTRKVNGSLTSKTRSSDFAYDEDTGQLIEEIINGGVDQFLRTIHEYDTYGHEIATYQCSDHAGIDSFNGCKNSSVIARPKTNSYIHRYSKTLYENVWNEYAEQKIEPFTSYGNTFDMNTDTGSALFSQLVEGSAVDRAVSTVTSRDIYGSPTSIIDMYGNESATTYGIFGQAQATATSLGSKTTTTNGWCVATTINQHPTGCNIVITSTPVVGAISRKYLDVLGREIRSQSQDFNGDWTTVDTYYDRRGQTVKQSEPYTRNASNNTIAITPSYTETKYDDLDRIVRIISPQHCQEDITSGSGSCAFQNVITTTSYQDLSVAVTNPLGQTTTQYFDESGKVVSSKDNDGVSVSYQYDANGNLTKTTGPLSVITMTYDTLGRKYSMQDPDKGTWRYRYNALGELRFQDIDNDFQRYERSYYDVRGRMYYKFGFLDGVKSEVSLWEYDLYGDDGLLANEYSVSGYDYSSSINIAQAKHFVYDTYYRPSETINIIYDGESDQPKDYTTKVTYDQYGRAFQSFDATGNGVLFQYNNYGFQYITRDAANGVAGQIYHQVINTDSRGNVINEKFYDTINSSKTYAPKTGFLRSIYTSGASGQLQHLSYAFDKIGNLIRRTDFMASNTPGADNISETFEYDSLNRLEYQYLDFANDVEASYHYDSSGNLTSKHGLGLDYDQTGNAGPHAVTSASNGKSYVYDTVGNVIQRKQNSVIEATFVYTNFDKPHTITANDWRAEIVYGAGRSRYIRKDINPSMGKRKVTHYLGSVEYSYENGTTKAKRYIGNLVINVDNDSASRQQWDFNFLLKDHIGSTHTIVDRFGNAIDRMSFNAWGQRRKAPANDNANGNNYDIIPITNVWDDLGGSIEATTNRGFTGHEHFDQVGIIHMNGRIYDPTIGRFLQADPVIQDPYNTQSLNRYSYVMNNPLSYTDPTGYFRLRDGWERQIAAIAVMFIPGAQTYGMIFLQGALSGAIATGSLKGALKGGLQAAVTFGIGHGFGGKGIGVEGSITRAIAHGVVGGISAELDGGKFGHGFASSVLTSGADKLGLKELDHAGSRIIANAIVAGTISEITGGKFANGAMSAAFRVAFNDLAGGNPQKVDRSKLSENEQDKFDYYYITSVDGIADNVDNAIADTGIFSYLIGRSGTNIDPEQRYIYLRKYGTLIDLQHVVSAAYNPFTGIGAGDAAGYAYESIQQLKGFQSAMQTEDLFSNTVGSNIGFRHARIEASRYGKTVGWKVQQFILNSDPVLSSHKALSIYYNNKNQ